MRFVRCVSVHRERRACLLFLPPHTLAAEIMKKNKTSNGAAKKKAVKVDDKEAASTEQAPVKVDSLDDEEQGFGGWLRSSDGLETMKLFVIANSIVMLTTLVYPHIQIVFEIVSDMIHGADIPYDE
ncbi:exit protein of rhodopsin and TRP A [Anticarsia gemmatalis]|uniref:exit protein of rhodopsin and TRP A n=1 Tax=Anticarsia gemmatalis TaxID=129554 RepID=UPI003F7731AF